MRSHASALSGLCSCAALLALAACATDRLRPNLAELPEPFARYDATRQPVYASFDRESRYLTMRDGVRIAIDVLRPEGVPADTRLPTMLHQTRYWRSVELRWPVTLFVNELRVAGMMGRLKEAFLSRGYAWVDVDARGSGASFGSRPWDYSPAEIADGAEVVDWIVAQPWSNGRVGGIGVSFSGNAAEFLLINGHPAVKAIAPLHSEFDQYADILAPGGVPQSWWFEDWGALTASLDRGEVPDLGWAARLFARGVRPVDEDRERQVLREALGAHEANYDFRVLAALVDRDDVPIDLDGAVSDEAARSRESALAALEERFGPDYLDLGVDLASAHAYVDSVRASGAAVYSWSGWLDGANQYAAIKRHRTLDDPKHRLLIGPWDHAFHQTAAPGGAPRPPFPHAARLIAFFDLHLKGIESGIERDPPVHYYTLGAERWRAAEAWPPPAAHWTLHLAEGGALVERAPDTHGTAASLHVDPALGAGLETRWDGLTGRPLKAPYPDRAERDRRLLVYETEPLHASTEVTGHPLVTLYVSSTADDGYFFVYLEDVAPDGDVMHVTEGMLRARHRATLDEPRADGLALPHRTFRSEHARPLPTASPAELTFELLPTSYVFGAGHRIRIALSGSDVDHFAQPYDARPTVKIHLELDHASRIHLPVVGRELSDKTPGGRGRDR